MKELSAAAVMLILEDKLNSFLKQNVVTELIVVM